MEKQKYLFLDRAIIRATLKYAFEESPSRVFLNLEDGVMNCVPDVCYVKPLNPKIGEIVEGAFSIHWKVKPFIRDGKLLYQAQ